MSVLIVIPARFASSRFPGKPLETLRGATGVEKPLVLRTWEAAAAANGVDRVVVATDDIRIRDAVEAFGGECVMTSPACRNGTERCFAAIERLGGRHDVVINLQGDAPLTPPNFIESLVGAMQADPNVQVATPVVRFDRRTLEGFEEDRRNNRVGGTTAVFDARHRALYFSKEIIPWTGFSFISGDPLPVFHHAGVYGYTPEALRWYRRCKPGVLETCEGLEQLRFLEHGMEILCVEVQAEHQLFWEVNNPDDIARIEQRLQSLGIE